MSKKLIAVIPCYNEEKRLNKKAFYDALFQYPHLMILFVNDGSSDKTSQVIDDMHDKMPNQIETLHLANNKGKANAVFQGAKQAIAMNPEFVGYLDADLAVSMEEFEKLMQIAISKNKIFVFGSRWKRIGSNIIRKTSRHFSGRIFATIASNMLKLSVYDTQCGAKVFSKSTAEFVFSEPFSVDWAFDVEIFFRLLKKYPVEIFDQYCVEIPLLEWRDVEGSKVKLRHGFRIVLDFLKLKKKYR
jgi:dolichyl-phosphate beta-glucosyltransferase